MNKILKKLTDRWFLFAATTLALVPFLNLRVLRMAGDEKVYITQALEMARRGEWFVQTMADEPSYFKGPMHYILIRIGMLVFGDHIIAGTWMNYAFALASGFALYALGRKYFDPARALLLGLATALNVGVFSHVVVSQMEIEVYFFYAFGLAALGLAGDKPKTWKTDLPFWGVIGLAGWSKSPLHSVLIGLGAILYWQATRQLWDRIKNPKFWIAPILGVLIGFAGFLPAALVDTKNFYETFILREQFQKANNNRAWHYTLTPLIHFLLPWTIFALVAIGRVVRSVLKKLERDDQRMFKLGLAMALPTLIMWSTWTYKGQNYNLPAIPALLLFTFAALPKLTHWRWAEKLTAALGAIFFFAMVALFTHFWPLPDWWCRGWIAVTVAAAAGFATCFYIAQGNVRILGLGSVLFCITFGAFIAPLGEREMRDMRQYIKDHPQTTFHYYNLDPSIWSEWALLQLTLQHPMYGLHREAQYTEAMKPGHAIIVQNTKWLENVMSRWRTENKSHRPDPVVTPWTRWLTKGTTSDGQSRWKLAWQKRDLRLLEREFFIVEFR